MAWTEKLPSNNYRAGYYLRGEKITLRGTYRHKTAARKAAEQAEQEAHATPWADPTAAQQTWADWAAHWFPNRTVEPSTQQRDTSRLKHVHQRWADTPLEAITRYDIKAWAADLQRQGLSPASTGRIISLLSASLTAAADAGVIATNPALRLNLRLQTKHSERVLTRAEQRAIFQQLPTDLDRALVAILLGSGGRWSEAIALSANHITPEQIRYRRAWDSATRKLKPYTKGKQRRTVPIAPWVTETITPLIQARPNGLLFKSRGTGPIIYSNWRNRVWLPTLEHAQIDQTHDDPVTIHTLRHTFATEQLEAGVRLADIATMLGHSQMSMTERYAHRQAVTDERAAHAIADPRATPPEPEPTAPNVIRLDQFRRTN